MNIYSNYGFNDFIVCLGYRGFVIKEYFANYILHRSDIVVDLPTYFLEYLRSDGAPNWRISLVDMCAESMTGGRLRRIRHLLNRAAVPYDLWRRGMADVDINALTRVSQWVIIGLTVMVVRPPGRFGATVIQDNKVTRLKEKPAGDGNCINGGFFVLDRKKVIYRIHDSLCTLAKSAPFIV